MDFDATGKVSLDHLYVQEDPRPYFNALRELDYCIPQLAKPYFAKLVRQYRAVTGVTVPTVLDVGCSYGVNAALLNCDVTLDDLYERYGHPATAQLGRDELLAGDRDFVRSHSHPDRTSFVGLDSSAPALAYAVAAGLLDDALHADFEAHEASDDQRERLARADLVISTGCLGYVGERTIRQIATASGERQPWMAHFVLRMFPYEPIAESLSELGYETTQVEGTFRQRRFACADEQSQVLDRLSASGIDARGLEADGWLYAQLHLSLPRHQA